MRIENSVALVTGGNRGIGEAFVRALLAAGSAKVYVGTRELGAAAHLAEETPGRAIPVQLDVTDPVQVARVASECPDTSILVNNAGAFLNQRLIGAPNLDAARAEAEIHYLAPLPTARAFTPILAGNGGGVIVNVLSSGGLVAVPAMGGYSPSKFAGRAATTCIRAELAYQKIQVIALIVGSVDTRMAAHVAGFKEPPSAIAKAGLDVIRKGLEEVDTDRMAIEVRASLARDPKALERSMARMLQATQISTGR